MYMSHLLSAFIQEIKKEASEWLYTPYFPAPQKSASVPYNIFVKNKTVKVQFTSFNDLISEGKK